MRSVAVYFTPSTARDFMTASSNPPPEQPSEPDSPATPEQVGELLTSPEMAKAVESDEFKRFLDHVPIAVVISWQVADEQRIVYANLAFEKLNGLSFADIDGKPWSVLDTFVHEDDPHLTLGHAVLNGEDFLGSFRKLQNDEAGEEKPVVLAQAYASLIEGEDGSEGYRIAALVDVTDRERSQRDEFERKIRDKDLLLRELQHRVKNNLQLITALIRLESRAAQRGDNVDLSRLASRIDTLALLYQVMSTEHWGAQVDLGPYLSEIATAAVRTHAVEGVQLDLKVSYCPVSVNVAMPVGLLVNELLTNAFKYAFMGREHGVISLECLCEDDERYRIVFADDGVGFPQGAVWPGRGKLGALILQTLRENTRLLDFKLESIPGGGTRVQIEFTHRPAMHKAN
jgi:PAS domain S-box-containing protein